MRKVEEEGDGPARKSAALEEDENLFAAHLVDNQEEDERDYCEAALQDDRTGEAMDPVKLRAARLVELSSIRKTGVWDEADRAECEERTGRCPTSVRWVDVATEGGVRSRLVARDFATSA